MNREDTMQRHQISVNGWTILYHPDPIRHNWINVDACYRFISETNEKIEHPLLQNGTLRGVDGNLWAELLRSCREWKRP
jgi:hypothetical protein